MAGPMLRCTYSGWDSWGNTQAACILTMLDTSLSMEMIKKSVILQTAWILEKVLNMECVPGVPRL